jgi:hypothetical protein
LPFTAQHFANFKHDIYGDVLQRVREWEGQRKQAG